MESANWLPIVSIIISAATTLAAPTLALFAAPRMNQPRPKPEPKNPKNRTQRIGAWFMRVSRFSPVLSLLAIVFNIWALHHEINRSTPITRDTILGISLLAAMLFFNGSYCLHLVHTIRHQFATFFSGETSVIHA
jgi:hypothetical protein